MHYFNDFKEDLSWVFQSCRERISSYPPSCRNEGIQYLEKFDVFKNESHKNYICYLLPFWIRDLLRIENGISREISIANTFLMLYFFVQDDVMDTAPDEYKGDMLPLGNLFMLDFMEHYHRLFPSNSPFWTYMKEYTTKWAESVLQERHKHWKHNNDFTSTDLSMMAQKAAPLKAAAAASCFLGGKENYLQPISDVVDLILVSMQLLDDWADWPEDLASGNLTYFLNQVIKCTGMENYSSLNCADVKRAVFLFDVLDDIFSIIENNHIQMKAFSAPDMSYLVSFHENLLLICRNILSQVKEEKEAFFKGGLSYYLSKNT